MDNYKITRLKSELAKKTALEYQVKILPQVKKAEEYARAIVDSFGINVPKIYELIPNKGIRNKFTRLFYRIIE